MNTQQLEDYLNKSKIMQTRLTLLRAHDMAAFRAWMDTVGQPIEVFRAAEYRYNVLNGFKNALRDQLYTLYS